MVDAAAVFGRVVPLTALMVLSLDLACGDAQRWAAEDCENGIDDNLDESIDCEDVQCEGAAACRERVTSPDLPEWLKTTKSDGSNHPSGRPCDEVPAAGPPVTMQCTMAPDSCEVGLRCVVVSVAGVGVDTACVRQGCAPALSPCHLGDFPDVCSRGTLCLDVPDWCGDAPCCVPLCRLDKEECATCLPLERVFAATEGAKDEATREHSGENLQGAGLCLDPV